MKRVITALDLCKNLPFKQSYKHQTKVKAKNAISRVKNSLELSAETDAEDERCFCSLKVWTRIWVRIFVNGNELVQLRETSRISTYFCKPASAPQYRTLSGAANSVSPFSSGLMILMYVSWPRYHLSRFSARIFHTPTLSREIKTAVQASA